MKPPRKTHSLYLLAAYNLGLWSMIELLVFTFRNMIVWKAPGYHGLDSLGIAGTAGGLGDHM